MRASAAPQMACRACGSVLNTYTDLHTGEVTYLHPVHQHGDHPADPVPAGEIQAHRYCEFCLSPRLIYSYTAAPVALSTTAGADQIRELFGSDWAACFSCAELIEARDLVGLNRRARGQLPAVEDLAHRIGDHMREAFLRSVTGRAIDTTGTWTPVPLPARTLPKVRDRLRQLVVSGERLPGDLHTPALRRPVADGLHAAGLYWADDDTSALVRHTTATMPALRPTAGDLPAPHGLLAWAQPVGPHHDLTAASWTSVDDGVLLTVHRSIGDGLPEHTLQRLRAAIGWLIPFRTSLLRAGDGVTADHPAAALVLTWHLIRQRLTETAPAAVDKSIRAAYTRTGRPAPDVRMVRIRGRSVRSADRRTREPGGTSRPLEHRVWVSAHWRWQPCGPGRRNREWILIAPHLRGPDDRPVKTSTAVRVLATTPPTPPPRAGR